MVPARLSESAKACQPARSVSAAPCSCCSGRADRSFQMVSWLACACSPLSSGAVNTRSRAAANGLLFASSAWARASWLRICWLTGSSPRRSNDGCCSACSAFRAPRRRVRFRPAASGRNLLRRLQCVQLDLLQNTAGLRAVALLNALIGSCQAQLSGLFGVALLSLLQQLLSGCLRPGQFAERGRGSWSRLRAGWRRRGEEGRKQAIG